MGCERTLKEENPFSEKNGSKGCLKKTKRRQFCGKLPLIMVEINIYELLTKSTENKRKSENKRNLIVGPAFRGKTYRVRKKTQIKTNPKTE